MVVILILLAAALVALCVTYVLFTALPDSRTSPGAKVKVAMVITAVLLLGAGLAVSLIKVQEATGIETKLSGGAESDARQWIQANSPQAPVVNQPGENIKILREGMAWLRAHPNVADTAEARSIMQRFGALPERPTKLLSRDEESQYYSGASAVWTLINGIAK